MEVRIETTYGATKKFVAAGLEAFNRQHQTGSLPKSFAVTVRENEAARGGLVAEGVGQWMVFTLLWVEDQYRRRGFGTSLLRAAEAESKKRGAVGALVDTYSFQAPAFYKMNGYTAYGQVDDFPEAGMTWFRFKKAL
ncbi:Acetyltransferase EC 231 [Bradyrhizobium sp.]|uniref:GNAT family N-acetyltransferase n=1 Tax=Bradyrhizobium sp. TaxID=376 RepID=UPI0007C1CFAA|nr:GNAT family N-acetyltransferase [Bradyrhizobium sp.]CUT09524.1 Acetyltransferase EC 231 [Bradyrhizobium sp.]